MDITRLPGFMHDLKWLNAEALMRRWFAAPPNDDPNLGTADTTSIKMEWILAFPRARAVYDSIFNDKIWMQPKAQRALRDTYEANVKMSKPFAFGDLKRPPMDLHKEQTTFARVGGSGTIEQMAYQMKSPLDDLYGALGRFNFYVNLEGTAKPSPTGPCEFTISRVGVHVKDSYDFNDAQGDDQLLGYWNFASGTPHKVKLYSSEAVHNSDFRAWRTANKKGGDFYVCSDLLITSSPSVISI